MPEPRALTCEERTAWYVMNWHVADWRWYRPCDQPVMDIPGPWDYAAWTPAPSGWMDYGNPAAGVSVATYGGGGGTDLKGFFFSDNDLNLNLSVIEVVIRPDINVETPVTPQEPAGPAPIPLPAAGWMLLAGLGFLGCWKARR